MCQGSRERIECHGIEECTSPEDKYQGPDAKGFQSRIPGAGTKQRRLPVDLLAAEIGFSGLGCGLSVLEGR